MSYKNYCVSSFHIKELLDDGRYNLALDCLHYCAGDYDYENRRNWIHEFRSWALPPTKEQLEDVFELFQGMNILEVGAGTGLWAAILKSRGLNVVPTDDKSENKSDDIECSCYGCSKQFLPSNVYNRFPDNLLGRRISEYTSVKSLDAEKALREYGGKSDVLFISWGRGFITEDDFKNFTGKFVMSIGEGSDGCTNNGYVDMLDKDPKWKIVKHIDIPTWMWINDWLTIYERI